jgi:hypothetical protein
MRWVVATLLRRLAVLFLLFALSVPAAASPDPVAHDPGGDRIEYFPWVNQFSGPDEPLRNCSRDQIWCAELIRPQPGGSWVVQVVARATNREPAERRWRYTLPDALLRGRSPGYTLWQEIVRDGWGGALIGVELWEQAGERPGFFSNQRRLLLIHIPSLAGAQPSAVLETPLSGHIEQRMCPSPGYPPDPTRAEARPARAPRNGEIRLAGVVSDEETARINACVDMFSLSTLFTLLPSSQPADQPPDLIVATVATTTPGRRPRTPPGTERAPIERMEGDEVRDPACTFTRTYYFDAAQGRYMPDAPLPACPDYLEP